MNRFISTVLLTILLSLPANSTELPNNLKSFLKNKFPGVSFKIDNSFVINNETYLPLVPEKTKATKKIEVTYVIPDKMLPKLFWFSNEWIFVKLIKKTDGTQTILDLKEVPLQYRDNFLRAQFPNDLVVPEKLVIKEELASLTATLPIKIQKSDTLQKKEEKVQKEPIKESIKKVEDKVEQNIQKTEISRENTKKMKGELYLTSPDTGKIVYVNLGDFSMVQHIQTMGAPWEIAFDKTNKLIFITDFAKDLIYKLKPQEASILKSLELPSMSSPRDIQLSNDGSLIYILESLSNDFAVYKTDNNEAFIRTKLPPNPSSFSFLNEAKLIGITCPSTNRLVFLNTNDFLRANQIMIEGGPEKIISDPVHNVFYVANRNGNTISIVDGSTKNLKNTIQVDETPTSLELDPRMQWLYVGNGKSNSISIIDLETQTVIYTIPLDAETQFPGDIEITKDGNWLIVTSETTNTISIIDLELKKVAIKLDVGATTHAAYIIEE